MRAFCTLGLAGCLAVAGIVHATDVDVEALLSEMKEAGANFDPQPLYQTGSPALAALLDRLLPESASLAPAAPQPPTELLRQLGANEYSVREAATQKLIALGPSVRPYLEKATHDRDPEIAERAQFALDKLPKPPRLPLARPAGITAGSVYGSAYRVYVEGLTDKDSLRLLAVRALGALQAGRVPQEYSSSDILRSSLAGLARHADDAILNTLAPALELESADTAARVIRAIAGNRPANFTPQLLTKAFESDRPALAREADAWLRRPGPAARPFHIPTPDGFALQGDYTGQFEVVDDHVIVWLEKGTVFRRPTSYAGRTAFDRLGCGLATQGKDGKSWSVQKHGNSLALYQAIEPEQTLALPPARFVIPTAAGKNLADYWLVFQTESHSPDVPEPDRRRVTGHCYAHSAHDIFQPAPAVEK